MKMKLIMESWRRHLEEITELPEEIFSTFEEEIGKSYFWLEDNDYDDLDDVGSGPPETPATMALTVAINKALKRAGMDDVTGIAHSSGSFSNSIWHSATIDVSKDGKPVFMILMNLWEDYENYGIPVAKMIKELSAALRHELVHLEQLKKQAKTKGIDLETAFKQMMDDPRQVVDRADYDTYEAYMKDYLALHIEVDGHAHQAAENLIDTYGKEKALDIISKDFELDDPVLPDEVKKYKNFDVNEKSMKKFRSKMYSYIEHHSKRRGLNEKINRKLF